jgi:hypothetical protein
MQERYRELVAVAKIAAGNFLQASPYHGKVSRLIFPSVWLYKNIKNNLTAVFVFISFFIIWGTPACVADLFMYLYLKRRNRVGIEIPLNRL